MDDDSTIDLTSLNQGLIERDLTKHIERQFVSSLADMPRVRHFFGRDEELDQIATLLEQSSTSVIVPGIAGIGKTALAVKVIERFTHRRNYYSIDARNGMDHAPFWRPLGSGRAIGPNGVIRLSSGCPNPSPSICSNLIIEGLNRTPSLIVIDDVHKISDEALVSILISVSERIDECKQSGIVLFTRSFRRMIPEFDTKGRRVSTYLRLEA